VRVFLDANVLFSAAYRETGSVRVFFGLSAGGACRIVSSAHAIEEARRNLASRYPRRLSDFEELLRQVEVAPEPRAATLDWAESMGLPPKDAPILAAAVHSRCHVLATGDRADFGHLMGRRLKGTIVMLPAEAIELLTG
jgi:predicted nucleic acid-binding protein